MNRKPGPEKQVFIQHNDLSNSQYFTENGKNYKKDNTNAEVIKF